MMGFHGWQGRWSANADLKMLRAAGPVQVFCMDHGSVHLCPDYADVWSFGSSTCRLGTQPMPLPAAVGPQAMDAVGTGQKSDCVPPELFAS